MKLFRRASDEDDAVVFAAYVIASAIDRVREKRD